MASVGAVVNMGPELAQINNRGSAEKTVVSAVTFLLQRSDWGGVFFVSGVESGGASCGCGGTCAFAWGV